jgi:hypothetical protein
VLARPVTVHIAGTSNITSPDDQIRKTVLELQARHAEEMQRINSETEARIQALQVQLQNAAEGHQTTENHARQLHSRLEETAAENESFKTAFAELEKRLALTEGNCEDLAGRLRAETEKNAVLEESIQLARATALSLEAFPAPPQVPAGPSPVIAENQALREENQKLKAELDLKDNTIRQLEMRLQEKDSFLVVRLKDGVNNGVVVFHGEGDKNVSQPKDVNITFGAADDKVDVGNGNALNQKIDAVSTANSEKSFDPDQMTRSVLEDPVFLESVKTALAKNPPVPGIFLSQLLKLEKFDEILPEIIEDLWRNDVEPFERDVRREALVFSFVHDIRKMQLTPAVFDQNALDNFKNGVKGLDKLGSLVMIPTGVPTTYAEDFYGTDLDPKDCARYFHDSCIEQYLTWNTETSNKLRELLSVEKPVPMSSVEADTSEGSADALDDGASTSSASASNAGSSSGPVKRSGWFDWIGSRT